jgi:hypothetical protein
MLGGKEWQIRNNNLIGLNTKITFMGPYWHHPVDEPASHLALDIVYDEDQPFTERYSNLESITDCSVYYRMNRYKTSSVFFIQVKNLLGKQYLGKKYNL